MLLKREFVIGKDTIEDPSPSTGDINVIKKLLSTDYPSIINTSHTVRIDEKRGVEIYTFQEAKVGTHG